MGKGPDGRWGGVVLEIFTVGGGGGVKAIFMVGGWWEGG